MYHCVSDPPLIFSVKDLASEKSAQEMCIAEIEDLKNTILNLRLQGAGDGKSKAANTSGSRTAVKDLSFAGVESSPAPRRSTTTTTSGATKPATTSTRRRRRKDPSKTTTATGGTTTTRRRRKRTSPKPATEEGAAVATSPSTAPPDTLDAELEAMLAKSDEQVARIQEHLKGTTTEEWM